MKTCKKAENWVLYCSFARSIEAFRDDIIPNEQYKYKYKLCFRTLMKQCAHVWIWMMCNRIGVQSELTLIIMIILFSVWIHLNCSLPTVCVNQSFVFTSNDILHVHLDSDESRFQFFLNHQLTITQSYFLFNLLIERR